MIARVLAVLLTLLALPAAAEPALTVAVGGAERVYTPSTLLARPDVVTIAVPKDASYGGAMTYRAVPLRALVPMDALPRDGVLEAVASDGFVAHLPSTLLAQTAGAEPYVAVEPPEALWPPLPGKGMSAGPFYVVWLKPEASGISAEQWPYQLARLLSADSPLARWPALGVAETLPADDPARAGQALFLANCLPCHTLNGGGGANVGPDLNRPMNPTEYLKPDALKRLIRDPASVRSWPEQRMPAFAEAALSDADLDRLVAYLGHMAGRKGK
ncbi:cytochrome c [Azospirillum sp. TSO22-1]|uniref:cytochrome c n=1 Tax=Azospirillum sp. TSO22-1 TaxID=716789 RepID=UPI000D61A114|nr:cytochrome c [Azospirillum sp. TSO22-1]PWC55140.1 cytochrome C [Azospirillum sp. TSO22-1]